MPGEQHDLGLLILALLLVRRGYRVVYLGADVPVHGLLPVVEQVSADLVCLSAATPETAAGAGAVAAALRGLPRPPAVVVGGKGVTESTAVDELYVALDANTLDAIAQIGTLISSQKSAVGSQQFGSQ